jgi:ubiquinone/menaquinone biosynthesis C-methylase UbiE
MRQTTRAELDPAIADFYQRTAEERRLDEGPFQLERLRTRELIERHAPTPPATVLDVGGAAGAYAFWLAGHGYEVHLVDAVPRLIEQALRLNADAEWPLASCRVGDARQIPFPDASARVVLLLGPLYHLTDVEDRVRTLREAARVLEPGGVLFAAGISRYASALDGLARDLFQDPRFAAIVERDLREGQHRNATERLDYFTTAFFHRPEELGAEVTSAGLVLEGLYGIEGPGWILSDFAERWEDPRRREDLVRVARMLESEPSIRGASAHLLAVGRRPG